VPARALGINTGRWALLRRSRRKEKKNGLRELCQEECSSETQEIRGANSRIPRGMTRARSRERSIAWPRNKFCTIELSVASFPALFPPSSLFHFPSSPSPRLSPYRGNLRIPRRLGGKVIPLISDPTKLFGGQIRIYLLRSLARSPLSRAGATERRPTFLFDSGPRRYLIP